MKITAAKTLIDTQCGVRFARSLRWLSRNLLFLDVHDRCVKSVDLEGVVRTVRVLQYLPGGFQVFADGRMIVGDAQHQKIFLLDGVDAEEVADLSHLTGSFLCDSVIDSHGGIYVTSAGFDFLDPLVDPVSKGIIAHIREDGESSVVATDLFLPNAMVVTPDNKTLVVAETRGHRLTAFDINDDGSLNNRRVWAQFKDDINPDGICLDSDNAIWVAGSAPLAFHVREGGEVDRQITTERPVFATMLGGPELRHLFLFTSDSNDPVVTRRASSVTIAMVEIDTPGVNLISACDIWRPNPSNSILR